MNNVTNPAKYKYFANHMWKGFSEIEIFWVNFNF